MIYEYRCRACGSIVEQIHSVADRDNPSPCTCGGAVRRILSVPQVNWNEMGALSGDFPSASDRWFRDRERRKQRERENVKNHGEGNEYPNLRHT